MKSINSAINTLVVRCLVRYLLKWGIFIVRLLFTQESRVFMISKCFFLKFDKKKKEEAKS